MSDGDRPSIPESPSGSPAPGSVSMKGPLAWMAQHRTASNLLMILLDAGGALLLPQIKQEVFPEFDLDIVLINVPYPGASPSEVEQGVILATEEAVRGLDGVKEVRGTASESVGVVTVELLLGTDADRALSDIKASVDRITSYPEDVERPVVALARTRGQVLSLVVHGDRSERELRLLADRTRSELLTDSRITQVELAAARPYEISIEVPQENLRRFGLTIDQVATRIRQASVEIPGGGVRTDSGEILVRTSERRLTGSEFEDIVLLSRPDGSQITVRDVAVVDDGFQDTEQEARFDGELATLVQVYRVGSETPITVSEAVHEYIEKNEARLPEGVHFAVWNDRSDVYQQRVDLLVQNGWIGLILVLMILGLFLEIRLAFWVTMGIPISFIGSLLVMPTLGVSLNMISLFAFIVTLGLVVDDAIVVGEAIYKRQQEGYNRLEAAVLGVREVAAPVVFSIATSCIAFSPMLFVPGATGKFFRVIPLIVITVLLMSLVESLFILPAHLAHKNKTIGLFLKALLFVKHLNRVIEPLQRRFSLWFEGFVDGRFTVILRRVVTFRYITLAICLSMFIATVGFVAGDRISFTFLPKIEADVVTASLEMPFGSSIDRTRVVAEELESSLRETLGADVVNTSRGIFMELGSASSGGGPRGGSNSAGSHLAQVKVYLVPMDERDFGAADLVRRWRANMGEVVGVESLTYSFSTGPSGETPIDVELSHENLEQLELAASQLAAKIETYAGTRDVNDGFALGKRQLDFSLTPEARSLGLTEIDLARQLRSAFFGSEAVRQQRGREEVRVYVRRPVAERESLFSLEQFIVQLPSGGELPLGQAATIVPGRAYTSIRRVDGRRVVNVTANVEDGVNANRIMRTIQEQAVPGLLADVEGLNQKPGGEQKRQAETLGSLKSGAIIALIAMFGLLAVAFRSYIQPAVVMSAIPFGFIGAVIGHLFMGYDLSLMSMMGIVALSGVVVNDSLILVVAANEFSKTHPIHEAVVLAAARRFRPILLTSLTTSFGLAPMILETSMQARFLIPMAISLGFGVLFATFIILLLVPCLYLIVNDVVKGGGAAVAFIYGDDSDDGADDKTGGDGHGDDASGQSLPNDSPVPDEVKERFGLPGDQNAAAYSAQGYSEE